ncbi:MAG: hypothetical protein KatS3mg103_0761 [Phycisphaerales bacterium]|nr:MAG: hypothetical protein KatS3mg103_0761 [Phycisphaerales bacterium]
MVAQDAPALDEQVLEALTYVGLFADDTWAATLAEDAQELETPWEPSAESWSLDGLMGAG